MTVDDAKAQVAGLEADAAAIDQESVGVKEQIKSSKAKLEQKRSDVAAQTAKVTQMRQQVGQVALAQFQNRSLNTTARLLLTEDTDGFLNQVSTVEKVSQNQNSALQDYPVRAGRARRVSSAPPPPTWPSWRHSRRA